MNQFHQAVVALCLRHQLHRINHILYIEKPHLHMSSNFITLFAESSVYNVYMCVSVRLCVSNAFFIQYSVIKR